VRIDDRAGLDRIPKRALRRREPYVIRRPHVPKPAKHRIAMSGQPDVPAGHPRERGARDVTDSNPQNVGIRAGPHEARDAKARNLDAADNRSRRRG
jgi:hypothetical protein